ncbi:hypothetical protein [uncultured Gimesia sp.]|uniref:COG1470 family protein n=1 Tax=uncultured Gimesia sp. TaxID=1678688 RepID=UPI0030DBAECD
MPESDDLNSSLNRRELLSSKSETEEIIHSEIEETEVGSSLESDWDNNNLDDEIDNFDLSFKFEDYAPVWMQKLKSLYGADPEWSFASTFGAVAIILTVLLLLAMPEDNVKKVADAIIPPDSELVSSVPEFTPIDTRIAVDLEVALPVVELGSEPLYVSFGDLTDSFSGIAAREEQPMRREFSPTLPEFNLIPEPTASAPELVMDVKKIRIIEREMLDPAIDDAFFVEAKPLQTEIFSQLEPSERLLFDQSWRLINLARAETQIQQIIRPTLYHERFPGGEHLQVGQEQPLDRNHLDRLTQVMAPQAEEQLDIEIQKQVPLKGTVQNLLTYSILVTNRGSSPAYDIHVDETVSPGASLVDLSPPAEVKQNHLHWKIARLDPNEERELQVKVFLDQTGSVKTNSEITLVSNVASSTEILTPQLDLQIKGPEVISEGDVFPLDLIVRNQGRQNQEQILLNLDLPEGLEHQAGNQLTLSIDQLAAGESRTLRARVKAVKPGNVKSQAKLVSHDLSLGEAAWELTIVEKPIERQPKPQPQKSVPTTPSAPVKPGAVQPGPIQPGPVQSCPCQPQPIYLPVLYLYP